MTFARSSFYLPLLLLAACASAPQPLYPDFQAVVETTAKKYPQVVRLTLHTTPTGSSGPVVVASTMAEKLGKPSDPEDLKAMAKAEVVVLAGATEYDVTVPILQQGGFYTAACGVTFKIEAARDRRLIDELAKAIAAEIDGRLTLSRAMARR